MKLEDNKLLAEELHKPITRKFQRRAVYITGLDDTWSADLVIMPTADNTYKNILTVLDNFSKFGWLVPLKTKTNKELIKAFESIFTSSHRKPKRLWTDKGSEFFGSEFQIFLMNNNISLYTTQSEFKAMIVERFNRTIKSKMWKLFTERSDSKNWICLLPIIIDEYNNQIHSTIKMTPIDASLPENSANVKEMLISKIQKMVNKPPRFKLSDKVRIYQFKGTFDKSYKQNWTSEVFEIAKSHNTIPWTYTLTDKAGELILGKFYENEMIKSDFDFDNKLSIGGGIAKDVVKFIAKQIPEVGEYVSNTSLVDKVGNWAEKNIEVPLEALFTGKLREDTSIPKVAVLNDDMWTMIKDVVERSDLPIQDKMALDYYYKTIDKTRR